MMSYRLRISVLYVILFLVLALAACAQIVIGASTPALYLPVVRDADQYPFIGAEYMLRYEFDHEPYYDDWLRWARFTALLQDTDNTLEFAAFLEQAAVTGAEPVVSIMRDVTVSCQEPDAAAFATWAAEVVQEYPQVTYWEIWNEPDAELTGPSIWRFGYCGDAASYANLLSLTYDAIKAVRPETQILIGGIASVEDNAEWVETVLALAGDKFDIFNLHHYPFWHSSHPPSIDYYGLVTQPVIEQARLLLGDDRPIVLSETSLLCHENDPACPDPFDPADHGHAFYQRQGTYAAQLCYNPDNLLMILWYAATPNGWRDSDLLYLRGTERRKPAYHAWHCEG